MVWNKAADELTITAARKGYDAVLNGEAGRILSLFQLGMSAGADGEWSRSQHFLDQCMQYGWLSRDGVLQGCLRVVQKDPLLRRVQIELSLRCNLSCSYCYSESSPARHESLDTADVMRILAQAEECGVTWIDFTGGEFFLFPDWEAILEYARALGLVVTLHTNGTLLTERHVQSLVDNNVRHIQVSADSHLAAVHDRARGHRGAFDRLMRGVRLARASGVDVTVSLIAHKNNRDHFLDAVRWFADQDVKVIVDRVVPVGGGIEADLSLTTSEFYTLIAPLLSSERVNAGKICQTPGSAGVRVEPDCGVAHSFVYITAAGEYALCPTMTSREADTFAGPSVRAMSLAAAWETSDLFTRLRYTNCENTQHCPAAPECGGGCRSNAYVETGRLTAPDALSCNTHKNRGPVFIDFPTLYRQLSFE